jgi:hypothetical protein
MVAQIAYNIKTHTMAQIETQDELVIREQEEYLTQVTHSGMPLWIYENYYSHPLYIPLSIPYVNHEEVENNSPISEKDLPF